MLNTGEILDGKYKVVKLLGQGGMGTVYLCENIRLRNMWAIKEITMELGDGGDLPAETEILKNLKHPCIPRVIDVFHEGGKAFIVEDYIEGDNIETIVSRTGSMKAEKVCEIALQLCDIIGYLHSLNPPVIYRDLKPSNIMLTPDRKIMLIDFSISRLYKSNRESDTVAIGSKGYAAPEQYGTAQSGKQTDIYGLGATMYYMLTGQTPSRSASLGNIEIERIIKKAMDPDMKNRYKSVDEMKAAINSYIQNDAATKVLKDEAVNFKKTTVLNSKTVKKILNGKKTAVILSGVLVFFGLVLGMEYLLWGSKKAEPSKVENNDGITNANAEAAVSTSATNEEADTDTPVSVRYIYVNGAIQKELPAIIGKNNQAKGKKNKNKHQNTQVQDLFYVVNPNAQVIQSDERFAMEVKYVEFNDNMAYVYFNVDNITGSEVQIPSKNMYLTVDGEGTKKALVSDVYKIPDNTYDKEIKIPFQYFKLSKGTIKLHINICISPSTDGDIELNIDVV